MTGVGAVVIGRNEGARLERCLRSLAGRAAPIVYVDSGSTDGSVALARSLGVDVVELDLSVAFTAARARNAGWQRLLALAPETRLVQLVDGDCEIVDGWLAAAAAALDGDERVAVACGRRRERHPEASPWNRLCDLEWDTPVGDVAACGGDAMMRVEALREAGGYRETLIAGEEPELCLRLRAAGWRVRRLDRDMTIHDADMHRPSQWWRRAVRCGYAYAEGHALHGGPPHRYRARELRSIVLWAAVLPALAVLPAWPTWGASLALLAAYPVQWWRIRRARIARGDAPRDASLYARFVLLGKLPELVGVLRSRLDRWRGRPGRLIEYKGATPPRPAGSAAPVAPADGGSP